MTLIEWHAEFNTGVAEVDHEHRELVDLINKGIKAVQAKGIDKQLEKKWLK